MHFFLFALFKGTHPLLGLKGKAADINANSKAKTTARSSLHRVSGTQPSLSIPLLRSRRDPVPKLCACTGPGQDKREREV